MILSRFIVSALLTGLVLSGPALADDDSPTPPSQSWGLEGLVGGIDQAAAQRGFQVYSQSCANCHSMTYLHYRDLAGIGFTAAQIQTIAAAVTVPSGFDNQGNVVTKPATPASQFRSPFANEDAARDALNGALPPDMSLIVNTFPNGRNYIYAVLTGYADAPTGFTLGDGMSYNKYFPGHQIAMPPPLSDGQITYTDGTASTVAQNAHDVVTFLSWAAHPEMTQRKHLGFVVVLYFLGMSGITYALKRKIWADVH